MCCCVSRVADGDREGYSNGLPLGIVIDNRVADGDREGYSNKPRTLNVGRRRVADGDREGYSNCCHGRHAQGQG